MGRRADGESAPGISHLRHWPLPLDTSFTPSCATTCSTHHPFCNDVALGLLRTRVMDLPARKFLEERGIPHRNLEFPADTEKGAANVARALGYAEAQMVKTLIFETAAGERALVMLGGDKNAISGRLKRALGSRNIRLADPETVQTVTGYEIGSIPPFHWQPEGFRSIVDECLMSEEELGVGAGVWGQEIMIRPENLVAACGAEVFDLSGTG